MAELKQILGSMVFGASRGVTVKEMRKCLIDVSKSGDSETVAFEKVTEKNVQEALEELKRDLEKTKNGFILQETSAGFRYQSDATCGKWLKKLLDKGRQDRLSHPALETLAIIAYRQPVTKADIEAVRGVDVGYILKTLIEIQLVRIVGRSELPGRPFLYATTTAFLDHFGLSDLEDLGSIDAGHMARQQITKPMSLGGEVEEPPEPDLFSAAESKEEGEQQEEQSSEPVFAVDEQAAAEGVQEIEEEDSEAEGSESDDASVAEEDEDDEVEKPVAEEIEEADESDELESKDEVNVEEETVEEEADERE